FALTTTGCKRIATYAIDKELGDDGGLAALESSGSTGSTGSTKDPCKLITQAEVEAASGKKVIKADPMADNGCGWVLAGPDGTTPSGNITMQILPELAAKVIPMFGEQKPISGLGDKAEWVGGLAPTLRVHTKGNVLNFMLVDPSAMMKNPGITEKPVGPQTTTGGNSAVNMEYPDLEKTAIALAKDALARY
ncbi:MAG: hypothetical protein ACREMT_11850, partial [Vulcanimicrobiaceae bacterium]